MNVSFSSYDDELPTHKSRVLAIGLIFSCYAGFPQAGDIGVIEVAFQCIPPCKSPLASSHSPYVQKQISFRRMGNVVFRCFIQGDSFTPPTCRLILFTGPGMCPEMALEIG